MSLHKVIFSPKHAEKFAFLSVREENFKSAKNRIILADNCPKMLKNLLSPQRMGTGRKSDRITPELCEVLDITQLQRVFRFLPTGVSCGVPLVSKY